MTQVLFPQAVQVFGVLQSFHSFSLFSLQKVHRSEVRHPQLTHSPTLQTLLSTQIPFHCPLLNTDSCCCYVFLSCFTSGYFFFYTCLYFIYGYNVLFCLLGALGSTDPVILITSPAALPQIYGRVLRANLSRTMKD